MRKQMEVIKMDRGGRQTAEQAVRSRPALRPSALVLTTKQRLNLPQPVQGVLEILQRRQWELAVAIYRTYWQIGPAFPPVSKRRDHPGPPIRELTNDFGPGINTKRHKNMEEGSGEREKKTKTEAKMKRLSVRFTSLAARVFAADSYSRGAPLLL